MCILAYKNITMNIRYFMASITLLFSINVFGEDDNKNTFEVVMKSESYQLIKVSNSLVKWTWDKKSEFRSVDLLTITKMLDAENDTSTLLVRKYVNKITENNSKSIYLTDIMKRDEYYYFSKYWTSKGSVLTIVDYNKKGSDSDLNSLLGPLSKIPTFSYGDAKFNFHYKNETLSFNGCADRKIWSISKMYWAAAHVFLPLNEFDNIDIAVIDMTDPLSHMKDIGTFILIPNTFSNQ